MSTPSAAKIFSHLVTHQQAYLLVLVLLVLGLPFLQNSFRHQPVLLSDESYYHLAQAQTVSGKNFSYAGLHLLDTVIYNRGFFFIALGLALASLALFWAIAKKLALPTETTFLFLALLILSPVFIFTFSSFSGSSLFILLALSSIFLLLQKPPYRYGALVPIGAASFIDLFSAILLIGILLWFWRAQGRKKDQFVLFLAGIASLLFLNNWLLLNLPFTLGPFSTSSPLQDLFADVGSRSGLSIFLVLLAAIGLITAKKKEKLAAPIMLLALFAVLFSQNTNMLFSLALLLTFFATKGFLWLWQRTWTLESVKSISLFLIILGLLFSTISYLGRSAELTPTETAWEAFSWIRENVPKDTLLYGPPEEQLHLAYFARRPELATFIDEEKRELSEQITSAAYVQELFPILETRGIRYLLITPSLKASLPPDQGLLFLLKNKNFELQYAKDGIEIWKYQGGDYDRGQ